MLKYNFERVFSARGIKSSYSFFRRIGYGHNSARALSGGTKKYISLKDLYLICKHLNCNLHDLIEYIPGNEPEGHALYALLKKEPLADLYNQLRDVPLERIGEVEEAIRRVKGSQKAV